MTGKLLIINALTLVRIIGTIILVPIYMTFGGVYVGYLSVICYLTDSIDGILARKWHASTFFGALFDGVADKMFTIINFIVLYLITPYALIPIVFELLIVLVQIFKFRKNLNVKSNIVGKFKVWILAMCVVATFLISDITNISFLSNTIKDYLLNNFNADIYFYLLLPAIIIEGLTLLSYLLDLFNPVYQEEKIKTLNKIEDIKIKGNKWEKFKNSWLNPEFYEKHKDDNYLRELIKNKNPN